MSEKDGVFWGKGTLNPLLVRGEGEREIEITLDIILITMLKFDTFCFSTNAHVEVLFFIFHWLDFPEIVL